MKSALVILLLLVLGLAATLYYQHGSVGEQLVHLETAAHRWSNRWSQSQETLSVAAQTSARLQSEVTMRDTLLSLTSNELVQATNALAASAALVTEMQSELEGASGELWDRDSQVIALQSQLKQVERQLTRLRHENQTLLQKMAAEQKAAQERDAKREATVAAMKLERELMLTHSEELDQSLAQARKDLDEANQHLQQVQQQHSRLQAQWEDISAVRARLQVLESPASTAPNGD